MFHIISSKLRLRDGVDFMACFQVLCLKRTGVNPEVGIARWGSRIPATRDSQTLHSRAWDGFGGLFIRRACWQVQDFH